MEAFHSSYNGISSEVDNLLGRINEFSVSAISSDGLNSREQALQELYSEVEKRGCNFEEVLTSCDLLDTPFDHTQFENDISELQSKIKSANKVVCVCVCVFVCVCVCALVLLSTECCHRTWNDVYHLMSFARLFQTRIQN